MVRWRQQQQDNDYEVGADAERRQMVMVSGFRFAYASLQKASFLSDAQPEHYYVRTLA